MAAQLDPTFLTAWIQAELHERGELGQWHARRARAEEDGLDPEEAELEAAGAVADRMGFLSALEAAAGDLWLAEVREARGRPERLERMGPSCVAWLQATAGAPLRLERLARALAGDPLAQVAELDGLGGSPGCSQR